MPSSLDELPAHNYLESHPATRNKAVAVSNVSPGSVVLEVSAIHGGFVATLSQRSPM
jgi:SET and MYND domain-containing protein